MRRILILFAALGLLAGEPALAAPTPHADPSVNFGLIGTLVHALGQWAESTVSSAGQ